VLLQKISIPLPQKVVYLKPPTPSGNPMLVPYFLSKNGLFETPLPLGISVNLPWGEYGYFLKLPCYHFITIC